MIVAFGTAYDLGVQESANPLTSGYLNNGNVMFVGFIGNATTDTVNASWITPAGTQALTQLTQVQIPSDRDTRLFCLENAIQGTGTISITQSPFNFIAAISTSYKAGTNIDGTYAGTSIGASINGTISTFKNGDWAIVFAPGNGGTIQQEANQVLRVKSSTFPQYGMLDSNGTAIAGAGTFQVGWNVTNNNAIHMLALGTFLSSKALFFSYI